jgi:hypothetical protein
LAPSLCLFRFFRLFRLLIESPWFLTILSFIYWLSISLCFPHAVQRIVRCLFEDASIKTRRGSRPRWRELCRYNQGRLWWCGGQPWSSGSSSSPSSLTKVLNTQSTKSHWLLSTPWRRYSLPRVSAWNWDINRRHAYSLWPSAVCGYLVGWTLISDMGRNEFTERRAAHFIPDDPAEAPQIVLSLLVLHYFGSNVYLKQVNYFLFSVYIRQPFGCHM